MLRRMIAPPTNLGKEPEITKESNAFDRSTLDTADLRTYASADGKQKYLRVWSFDDAKSAVGASSWYEITDAPPVPTPDPIKTK